MVDVGEKSFRVASDLVRVFKAVKYRFLNRWDILFENLSEKEGELLFLTDMFEGAGTPELELHGARKSIVFVKFFQRSPGETEVVVITGGSEDILGFDFGRYKNIIGYVAVVFEGSESRKDDEVFLDPLEADDAFMAGSFEYNENHLEEALKLYTEAVRKDPRMPF